MARPARSALSGLAARPNLSKSVFYATGRGSFGWRLREIRQSKKVSDSVDGGGAYSLDSAEGVPRRKMTMFNAICDDAVSQRSADPRNQGQRGCRGLVDVHRQSGDEGFFCVCGMQDEALRKARCHVNGRAGR